MNGSCNELKSPEYSTFTFIMNNKLNKLQPNGDTWQRVSSGHGDTLGRGYPRDMGNPKQNKKRE